MASESRLQRFQPRSVPAIQSGPSTIALPKKTFQYTPLNKSVGEIRILMIHQKQTDKNDEPIKCTLIYTSFARKPLYKALSYTWGDQTVPYDGRVEVDGFPFYVGQNLGSALARMRKSVLRSVWVDAICINQNDVEEKSSQIPLMPFIYQRAQKCCVWLGEITQSPVSSDAQVLLWRYMFEDGKMIGRDSERRDLLRQLANNPYWQRVWIIQEIGFSRKREIMYGDCLAGWSELISHLRDELPDCIPLKLQRQLDDKYSDGHSLQHLIESHFSSLCQEPRDHIYGFVGLANDGQGFPIDYSKSHFGVWKDTIIFKHKSSASPQHDILSFGVSIKELLGEETIDQNEVVEDSIIYPAAVAKARNPSASLKSQWYPLLSNIQLEEIPGHITVPSRIAGRISYVGPSCSEIISFPTKTIDWGLGLNKHVDNHAKPLVREESDIFFEQLESLEDTKLEMVMSYNTEELGWSENSSAFGSRFIEPVERNPFAASPARPYSGRVVTSQDSINEAGQMLYLMKDTRRYPDDQTSPGSIGLAPPGTCEGDYVCQIHGTTRALVVRKLAPKSNYRIIGTALVVEHLEKARTMRYQYGEGEEEWEGERSPFQKANFNTIESEDRLDIHLDAARVYQLMD